ncbi:PAS domain-containing protein [Aquabacterium sp. OR-4]|uniref:PAS domain-containing protein n=1 Tax=Aquabacterium sp. OR-4 TaxID=2978127 RepID=UPI0028C7600A|nr:PAS domain-containing protein [Aquabacterium sp. OR-4]MDT7835679.1 PAS domain-containing protein [Aquabacterium sp. OR-4]
MPNPRPPSPTAAAPADTAGLDDDPSALRQAVALAEVASWRLPRGQGRLVANARSWALMDLAPPAQGMPMAQWLQRVHPDDLALLQPPGLADRPALRGGAPLDCVLRLYLGDGHWRRLMVRRTAWRDERGRLRGLAGVALDLTEHFDEQQRALALTRRLELATMAAGVGVWSSNPDAPVAQRLQWDAQMYALHDLPGDAMPPHLDDYLQQHVHPQDRDAVREGFATMLARRDGRIDLDLRVVRPDGSLRRLATRSAVETSPDGQRRLYGVALDVTERHAAEARLREATERAALAARGAGIGTWEVDASGQQCWWDAQMFRLRGLEPRPGPVHREEWQHWLHPADRDGSQAELLRALGEDQPSQHEFRVIWPDGSVRWLTSRSTAVRDELGRPLRRIGINWDSTDARLADEARQERALAQRESQAKSRLLARISHELRTPLNAVLGFTQLLLHDGTDSDPQVWRRRVEQVQTSGRHLLSLIDDVLDLSSLQSGELPQQLQAVELAPLVRGTVPLVELLGHDLGVSLHLDTVDGWVQADPVRLRQVLLNLLSNAIKYNRPGGRVTVRTRTAQGPAGMQRVLTVHDTGRGLTEDQIARMFEPFNRLGAERDGIAGTGIGLAIVKSAVEQMGGQVRVHSRLGEGSSFEVRLPMAEPPPQAGPAVRLGDGLPAQRGGNGRLLYIEDNEVNMLIVQELVARRPDLHFIGAVDGASGLAEARAQRPQLILLDIHLPDMDGHEVLARLRADPATAAIRCIAVSANAMPEDIRRAQAAGFDGYWTKPLEMTAFLQALDTLFGPADTPPATAALEPAPLPGPLPEGSANPPV